MWNKTQQDIIRGCYGEYAGTLLDFKLHGRYKEQFFDVSKPTQRVFAKDAIHLQTTEKTTRACRNCQCNGWTYVIMKGFGDLVVRRECGQCKGTRQVFG